MTNRSRGIRAFHRCNLALAKHAQNRLQPAANAQIDKRKENCSQRGHNEHHHSGQKYFAPGWPDDFGNLGTDLLDKLDRIGSGHLAFVPLLTNIRDITGQNANFKAAFQARMIVMS